MLNKTSWFSSGTGKAWRQPTAVSTPNSAERAESRSGRALHPLVHQLRHMNKSVSIQSGREAGQRKPVFAQPLNTWKSMKVLFLVPKPGCT